jgi:hypothetical protein
VVERFSDEYSAGDYASACRETSDYTDIARVGSYIVAEYAKHRGRMRVDLDHGCAGVLRSIASADPRFVDELAAGRVENVDERSKSALVQTDVASWDVTRFGGRWKLADLDALIPQ